jgi:ethanolamine utilization microcompartment shell protein EutL
MLTDPVQISVSGENTPRSYITAWDPEFALDIATGSVTVRTSKLFGADNAVIGKSVLKIAHSEAKGIRRDQVLLRDTYTEPTAGKTSTQDQVYIVISGPSSGDRERLLNMAMAFAAFLSGTASPIDEALNGQG